MKLFLPTLLLLFGVLFFVQPVSAATVRGCEVQGPADSQTGGTSYVCNPGVKVSGFTCMVANTQQAPVYWQNDATGQTGTPPTQTSIPSGCAPADVFLSGGASRFWVAPTVSDTARDVVTAALTSDINGSAHNSWWVQTTANNLTLSIAGLNIEGNTGTALQGGALGFFASTIGTMANVPPASSVDYTRYMASRLQVPGTRPAYAATGGTGYNSLEPILFIWSAARNIAYLFFAIAFIVVGVQIMLGSKLKDGKTALSIQMALPKIIIAFLLVTFSYAIAGFVIDLMYVLIQLIFAIMKPLFDQTDVGIFTNFSSYESLRESALSGENLFQFLLRGVPYQASNFTAFQQAIATIVASFTGSGPIQSIIGNVTGGIVTLVIAVAMLYAMFKTWLKLLVAYVQIILAVITGPLLLMFDALPGSNNFEGYIRTLLANALMFPTVIGLTFLSVLITTNFGQGLGATSGFVPPLLGTTGGPQVLQALLGIGILLSIPGILDKLPELLKAPSMALSKAWMDPVQNNYVSRMSGAIAKQKSDNFNKMVIEAGAPGEVKHPGSAPIAPPDWVHNEATTPLAAGATAAEIARHEYALRAMDNHQGEFKSWQGKVDKYNAYKKKYSTRAQARTAETLGGIMGYPGISQVMTGPGSAAGAAAGK